MTHNSSPAKTQNYSRRYSSAWLCSTHFRLTGKGSARSAGPVSTISAWRTWRYPATRHSRWSRNTTRSKTACWTTWPRASTRAAGSPTSSTASSSLHFPLYSSTTKSGITTSSSLTKGRSRNYLNLQTRQVTCSLSKKIMKTWMLNCTGFIEMLKLLPTRMIVKTWLLIYAVYNLRSAHPEAENRMIVN